MILSEQYILIWSLFNVFMLLLFLDCIVSPASKNQMYTLAVEQHQTLSSSPALERPSKYDKNKDNWKE